MAALEEESVKPDMRHIEELSAQLSALLDKDTSTKEGLREWYVKARHVQDSLTSAGGLGPLVPEMIWHYLADADIRSRDSVYRTQQEAFIRAFVRLLETGEIPDEADVRTLAADP